MLFDSLPSLFFKKHNDSTHKQVTEIHNPQIESFTAKELVEFIENSAEQARKFPLYREYLTNNQKYMKPYMDKGELIHGYYEMNSMFVSEMLERGYFEEPVRLPFAGQRMPLMTTRGVACNVGEIIKYQTQNMSSKNELTSLKTYSMTNQLVYHSFVVRLQESQNFDMFRARKHVGIWGEQLAQGANRHNHSTQYYKDAFDKYEEHHESFLLFDTYIVNEQKIHSRSIPLQRHLAFQRHRT